MVLPEPVRGSGDLLEEFGMPTLLWRVMQRFGYTERPVYRWISSTVYNAPWYHVTLAIPDMTEAPFWQSWRAVSDGSTPWEAGQVAALDIL